MLGKGVGNDKAKNAGRLVVLAPAVGHLQRRPLDRSVHALGLTIHPWLMGLGEHERNPTSRSAIRNEYPIWNLFFRSPDYEILGRRWNDGVP